MKQAKQYRQGDVLLEQVSPDENTDGFELVPREAGRVVLAHGETSGHAHAIAEPGARLFRNPAGARLLRLVRPLSLRHEEHPEIRLPKGTFRVVQQEEDVRGEYRPVAD